MKAKTLLFILAIAGVLAVTFVFSRQPDEAPPAPIEKPSEKTPADASIPYETIEKPSSVREKLIDTRSVPNATSHFRFTARIPTEWDIAAISQIEALSVYPFGKEKTSPLENSLIFIRHFTADHFLTLRTVDILERRETSINGRPSVRYRIKKKAGVPAFAHQPAWRNDEHVVTDIRISDQSPSVFYVIAKSPDLSEQAYQAFLTSLDTGESGRTLAEPITVFLSRVTKKPFGIFIEPKTSPVQPERFRGYHTGVDVEYEDASGDVPVNAIADGVVIFADRTTGYGGVAALRHSIGSENVIAIYGHLDPDRLPSLETRLERGMRIGFLGKGGTDETDGERTHLHFALFKGTQLDLRGYVQNAQELEKWHNPIEFFQEKR